MLINKKQQIKVYKSPNVCYNKNMKNVKSILLLAITFLLLCFSAVLFGCRTEGKTLYNLTYTASAGGYIEGETEQKVESGKDTQSVTAIPYAGYEFVMWSDGSTSPERQEKNVNSDMHFEAEFKAVDFVIPVPKEYSVIYNSGVGGYIEGKTHQIVKENEDAEKVTAIPEEGYEFKKWLDELKTAERQDRNITADKTYTAIFERIKLKVTYNAGVGGTIDGVVEQDLEYGQNARQVIAVPNFGYKFVKWSDGKGSAVRNEIDVTANICVTAEFEFLYEGGEGTQLNPFTIANYAQLNNIRYYPESNYKLINDLDLIGIKHEPVFDGKSYFQGSFDGDKHTIKNLTVETESNYPSLFGVVDGGIISGLNFESANIKTTDFDTSGNNKYCVGILAGKASGFINNVTVNGEINVDGLSYNGVAIGGLVGLANGTIADCNCDVQINIMHVYSDRLNYPFAFGGMIGVCDSAFIRDCNVGGQINVTECYWLESEDSSINQSTQLIVGGMVGYYIVDSQINAYIRYCRTEIEIYGDNHYEAGGFIGRISIYNEASLNIVNSSVHGNIKIGTAGGFICNGFSYGELIIKDCFVENSITAYLQAAGFIKSFIGSNNCLLSNCYSNSKLVTHKVGNPDITVGVAGGFSYQVSGINFENCYSIFDINTLRGSGFAYSLNGCNLYMCYSEGNFNLFTTKLNGLFTSALTSTNLHDCYFKSNINELQDKENIFVFTQVRNSNVTNFYYAGSDVKNVIFRIRDSQINNFHLLRSSTQEFEYVAQDTGSNPSVLDITLYSETKAMYYLADKLNVGQDEEVWINVLNNYPKLKTETNS